jgi:proteasome accessory factor A
MWRRPHYLAFLASHQVTSIVYTGQGKVGSENGRAPVDFQLAQRADFFETLCAEQTTYNRPLVNSRNESLCGDRDDDYARLHHIFTDGGLAQVATYLKVGTLQLVLAMLEAGDIALELLLDELVAAVVEISHDPSLRTPVALASGGGATALQVQRGVLERARRHGDRTGFPTVPDADAILECWQDTLDRLDTGELAAVSDRLDWAAKLELVELARRERANAGNPLGWDAPELKHLDLLHSSLDPAKGLYWAYQAAGAFHSVVDEAEIVRFTREPPDDTRAWTRAMLLRQFGSSGEIERVDWDRVVLDATGDDGRLRRVELALDDPCGHTRADNAHLFTRGVAAAASATGGDTPSPRSTI